MQLHNTTFLPSATNPTPQDEVISAARDWATEHLRTSHHSGNSLHLAEFDSVWLARTLATFKSRSKPEQFKIAKAYRTFLEANHEPADAAQLYFEHFSAFVPDKFKYSPRQMKIAAGKLLEPGEWGDRLFQKLPAPYFYTLSMKNLGLSEAYADSRFVYYSVVVETIKTAAKKLIPQPFTWKIEVGRAGNVHIHVIGPAAPALDHLQGSQRMKLIQVGTESTVLAYLEKPVAPWSETNYRNYLQAKYEKQTKTLPRLSGQLGLGNSRSK